MREMGKHWIKVMLIHRSMSNRHDEVDCIVQSTALISRGVYSIGTLLRPVLFAR